MKTTFLAALLCLLLPTFALAQTGVIQGRIYNSINNQPLEFATVGVPGTSVGTTTDLDGNYKLENLEPGLYNLMVTYVGFQSKNVYEIQVTNGKPATIDIAMEESAMQIEEIVVKAEAFNKSIESPVSLRTIGVAEIQRNPGGGRDISKVIQSLPGVTSTVSFRNDLIIRGGAPNENRFYLDDVEVPNINHFATQGASGGPVGLINVDFIREVDFYSGAFPASRGNALSSVFDFKQKDGRSDRIGFTATVGASDAGITLEGPITEKTTFLLSARQSYLQFLFKALELPFLPTYNDFQAKVKWKLDQKNEFTFLGLGAIDNFALNLEANETEDQRYLLDNLPVNEQWNYTTGIVYKRYLDNGFLTFVASRNMLNNTAQKYEDNDESDPNKLVLDYASQEVENKFRAEHTMLKKGYRLNYGVGYEFVKYNNRTFNKVSVPGIPDPITVDYSSAFNMQKYGLFAQVSHKYFNDRLALSLGVRADGTNYSNEMSNPFKQLSPRFSAAYAINDIVSLNFNSGLYYQLPAYTVLGYQENGELVAAQNDIEYIRNAHVVGGVEFNTEKDSKITVEGYYKRYWNYPFDLRDSISLANLGGDFGVVGNGPNTSYGGGQVYGMEFLFQQKLFKGYYGIVAYTLGWSRFEDKNLDLKPSAWDSRHIISMTGGKKFNKNWEVGLNWRFQSSLPYTPYDIERSSLTSVWDVTGIGLPDYDRLNSERNPSTHSLDVRVDKKWFFKKWSFNIYLDLENVYNNQAISQILVLDRDVDGNAQIDPNDASRYLLKQIDNPNGNLLPTLGVIVEF